MNSLHYVQGSLNIYEQTNDINTNITFVPIPYMYIGLIVVQMRQNFTFLKCSYSLYFIVFWGIVVLGFFIYHLAAASFAKKDGCNHTHTYNDLPKTIG